MGQRMGRNISGGRGHDDIEGVVEHIHKRTQSAVEHRHNGAEDGKQPKHNRSQIAEEHRYGGIQGVL